MTTQLIHKKQIRTKKEIDIIQKLGLYKCLCDKKQPAIKENSIYQWCGVTCEKCLKLRKKY